MYNDTIKTANKIITYEDLYEIFSAMNEKLISLKKIGEQEKIDNRMLEINYQKWTFKDNGSQLYFKVDFTDDTSIRFDNYNEFLSAFNNRLNEIKSIWASFSLIYSTSAPDTKSEFYNQRISMDITETRINVDFSLSSEDKKIDNIYELIKNTILNAPPRYDYVIKKKKKINLITTLGIGFIPALVITNLLLLIPLAKQIFMRSFILYPICCLALTIFIGKIIATIKLERLYKNISPEQKYVRYDSRNQRRVYEDDIEKYVREAEVLIGRNANNLICREKIMENYNRYKKYLVYEIIVLIVLTYVIYLLNAQIN